MNSKKKNVFDKILTVIKYKNIILNRYLIKFLFFDLIVTSIGGVDLDVKGANPPFIPLPNCAYVAMVTRVFAQTVCR